jgi:hypothetical protein
MPRINSVKQQRKVATALQSYRCTIAILMPRGFLKYSVLFCGHSLQLPASERRRKCEVTTLFRVGQKTPIETWIQAIL